MKFFNIYFDVDGKAAGGNFVTDPVTGKTVTKEMAAQAEAGRKALPVTQPSNFGGTAVTGDSKEGSKILTEADSMDEETRRDAELKAKGLQAIQNENEVKNDGNSLFGELTEEERQAALTNLDNIDATKHYKGDKEVQQAKAAMNASKANIINELDSTMAEIDAMNQADAAANASDFANEIAKHDITTEEGKAAVEGYLKQYESMLEKYEDAYNKNYNRALFFNAISSGIAQATGVPAIDFTKHPKVTEAKAWVDRVDSVLRDEKATAGAYGKAKLEKGIADREKATNDKKAIAMQKAELAKQIYDQDVNAYGATNLSNQMTKMSLEKAKADLGLGLEAYKPRMAEAKAGAREKEMTGTGWGETFLKGANDLVKRSAGMVADGLATTAKAL